MEKNIFQRMFSANATVDKHLQKRNPATNADEVAILLRILIYAATALTAALAVFVYINAFGSLPFYYALGIGIALAAIVEISKIWIMHKAIRSIVFGWAWKSYAALFFWGFIFCLGVFAYLYSIRVSTQGIEKVCYVVQRQADGTPTLDAETAALLTGIDAQIASANSTIATAKKTKWRNTITVDAQRIIKAQSKSIAALQAQRQEVLANGMALREKQDGLSETAAIDYAAWVRLIGGKLELLSIFCLICLVFFESLWAEANGFQKQGKSAIGFRQQATATAQHNAKPPSAQQATNTAPEQSHRTIVQGFRRAPEHSAPVRPQVPVQQPLTGEQAPEHVHEQIHIVRPNVPPEQGREQVANFVQAAPKRTANKAHILRQVRHEQSRTITAKEMRTIERTKQRMRQRCRRMGEGKTATDAQRQKSNSADAQALAQLGISTTYRVEKGRIKVEFESA